MRSITGAVLVAILIKSLEIMWAKFWDFNGALTALASALGAWLSRRRTGNRIATTSRI